LPRCSNGKAGTKRQSGAHSRTRLLTPIFNHARKFLLHFFHSNCSFAVAELQDCFNFNASSKVRAGQVLGRCHAALGEHALSVSAFDAAIGLAKLGRFLLSEALAIRSRVNAGQGAGTSALHWDKHEGSRRLAEVAERMQGPPELLHRLLGLPV
jgi:hypothetical protein